MVIAPESNTMKKGRGIFDFNGILFWDSEYEVTSWDDYLEIHDIKLTDAQKILMAIATASGKNNVDFL